jgi:hypothetical protein
MNEPFDKRYYGVQKLQPGPCIVCGLTDYPLSMGGPEICPACDCGIPSTDSGHPLRHKIEMTANDSTYLAMEIIGLRQLLAERDAQIERLQELAEQFRETAVWANQENDKLNKLIGELADALDIHSSTYPGAPIEKLLQRAREATKQ